MLGEQSMYGCVALCIVYSVRRELHAVLKQPQRTGLARVRNLTHIYLAVYATDPFNERRATRRRVHL